MTTWTEFLTMLPRDAVAVARDELAARSDMRGTTDTTHAEAAEATLVSMGFDRERAHLMTFDVVSDVCTAPSADGRWCGLSHRHRGTHR